MQAYKGYKNAEWFLIEGQTVRSISSEQAIDYAHQPPKLTLLNADKVVRQLLADDNVTTSGLVSAPKMGTERSTWPLWLGWFKSSGNLPMQHVMVEAMKL
ncbi:TPA: hypothetical protein I7682_17635 [Vibrio vulnificus]|nr:hypothetical protein [Vibrio vulnificus]